MNTINKKSCYLWLFNCLVRSHNLHFLTKVPFIRGCHVYTAKIVQAAADWNVNKAIAPTGAHVWQHGQRQACVDGVYYVIVSERVNETHTILFRFIYEYLIVCWHVKIFQQCAVKTIVLYRIAKRNKTTSFNSRVLTHVVDIITTLRNKVATSHLSNKTRYIYRYWAMLPEKYNQYSIWKSKGHVHTLGVWVPLY